MHFAVDRAAHANTYVGIGAGLCVILTGLAYPLWRAFRTARNERGEQTAMLTRVHAAMYGAPAVVENGVTVADAHDGLIARLGRVETQLSEGSAPLHDIAAKLDRNYQETNARLDQHEHRLDRLTRTAGEAAVRAAATHDEMRQLSGRMWTWVNDLQVRADGLTAVVRELGVDVDDMPPPPGDDDDGQPVDLHDP